MVNKFLKAKHWQLFSLMIGLPIVFQIIMMVVLFSKISFNDNPDPEVILNIMQYFPIIMIPYMAVFFGWFWSIGIGLQYKVPENVKMKTKKFKIFFFIPVVYMTLLCIFMSVMFYGIGAHLDNFQPNAGIISGIMLIVFPLHILSMFGMFYCLYFVAKTYKTVELQREVTFSDFIGEFFMLWFYFIGIWILQPKINEMVQEGES